MKIIRNKRPTPVSALIHAATMVTAGVFLVIRCSQLLEFSSKILFFMVFLGSLTCFFMSILGAFQQDIKKIVAYSTCSQLGYMFMGCGLSSYNTSFFHLFNHAFFKALLFLSMGVIIHAMMDEQDFRKMGNLLNFLPLTAIFVFFGNFALLGLPFLAGFYSKDVLIEVAFVRFYFDGGFSYLLGVFAVFFTAFYSTRLFLRIFFNNTNFNRYSIYNIHEVDILMFIPLILLLLCSFFVGYFFFDMFIGLGSFLFFDSIFINFFNYSSFDIEFLSWWNISELLLKENSKVDLLYITNNITTNPINYLDMKFYIKIIPLLFTILGINCYYFLDNRFIFYYYIYSYRLIFLIIYNGLFFDKIFIDVLVSKLYLFSYYSFYKNIELSFFQKYNILIFEKKIFNLYFFIKTYSKGQFFIYILLVLYFLFSYYMYLYTLIILNYIFFPIIITLFFFSFINKWKSLKIEKN